MHQSFSDSSSESSLKTSLKQQIKTPKSKEKSKILIATIKTLLAIIPKKRINPANIINGQISEAGIKYVSDETAQRLSSYRLNIGDVVIGRRGEMGRSAVVKQNHDQWLCGTGCFYVTTCDGFVPDYLVFLLKAPCFQGALLEKSVGTTMNNLNHTILSELLIPLPPTSEQIRIMNEYEHVCSLLPS